MKLRIDERDICLVSLFNKPSIGNWAPPLFIHYAGFSPITLALRDLANGDKTAFDRLLPLVYEELKRLAGYYLRQERAEHTLQPTALVHEAYFRLIGPSQPDFQGRSHFLGVAAHVMRQVLTDHARTRNASKRGSGQVIFSLDESMDAPIEGDSTVIKVDDALRALQIYDPLKEQLIEMRFFGGMTPRSPLRF